MSRGDVHNWPVRVYYEDTDAAGVVYYANYLKYLERGRTEWLREAGFDQSLLADEHGLAFAVRTLTADYRKPARLDDALTLQTRIGKLGRARVVFDQQLWRGEELLFTAQVQVACINARAMRAAPIPSWMQQRLRASLSL